MTSGFHTHLLVVSSERSTSRFSVEVMGLCSNPSAREPGGILSCPSSPGLARASFAAQSGTARTGSDPGGGTPSRNRHLRAVLLGPRSRCRVTASERREEVAGNLPEKIDNEPGREVADRIVDF